jgi:hypothetical protein
MSQEAFFMAETEMQVAEFVEKIPTPEEIRRDLCRNIREARLLRQLLRLAERRQEVREVAEPCR